MVIARIGIGLFMCLAQVVTRVAFAEPLCEPSCSPGYSCVDRQCRSPCNPPCQPGDFCATNGQCLRLVPIENASDAPAGIEPGPSRTEGPKTRRNSTGLMVVGLAITGTGGMLAVTALGLGAMANADCSGLDGQSLQACRQREDDSMTAYRNYLIAGLVISAVGVPFIVIGARRVPNEERNAGERRERILHGATLVLGPSGLSLRGQF